MPVTPRKGIEIQTIPADSTPAQTIDLVNSRFRDLVQGLKGNYILNADDTQDIHAGDRRITNSADPTNDTDVVNLRTLKKFRKGDAKTENKTGNTTGAGAQQYAAVFTKDGFVADAEESPFYTVDSRQGTTVDVCITAKTKPVTEQMKVNFKVIRKEKPDADLLTLPLAIEIGDQGPIFTDASNIAVRDVLPKGTLLYMVIVQGGDAEQVVGQVSLMPA